MDCLEFIARVTFHIPDKGKVTVRYYNLYASAPCGLWPPLLLQEDEEEEGRELSESGDRPTAADHH